MSWLDWLKYMSVPGLTASLLMLGLFLLRFKQTGLLTIDRGALRAEQRALGPMSRREKITLMWILAALVLWSTDFIHHIDPAWIALLVVVGLSLPKVGDVLEAKDITTGVNWPIVFFVVGALAIGTVGKATGMADWLAYVTMPANPPQNPYVFAGLIGSVTMLIHMVLGSALACMSIVAPPLIVWLQLRFGWQTTFLVTGGLGVGWLTLWWLFYETPERHPAISREEYALITEGRSSAPAPRATWQQLLRHRQVWAIVVSRFVTDPVWWLYITWLPLFLNKVHGFDLKKIGLFAWVPYVAADAGSLLGGFTSGYLIKHGWTVDRARKATILIGAAMMPAGTA